MDLEQDQPGKTPQPRDPWAPVYAGHPIGLVESIFWLAGSTLLQMGVGWLVKHGHVTPPEWSPEFGPQVAVMAFNTIVLLVYFKVVRKGRLGSLGLRVDRLGGDLRFAVLASIAAGVIYLVGAGLLWVGMNVVADDPGGTFKAWLRGAIFKDDSMLYILGVVLAFPVLEEIWFRGLMYAPMRKEWGKWAAMIVLSLLFAFAHSNLIPINQFIGGLIFVWAYEKRRTLVAPILLHMLGNGALWVVGWALVKYELV